MSHAQPRRLPPGFTQDDFNKFVDAIIPIVGKENLPIVSHDAELHDGDYVNPCKAHDMHAVYDKDFFISCAVVNPRSVPEVQEIMLGRNTGYGGAAPRVPGTLGIELGKHMNKIPIIALPEDIPDQLIAPILCGGVTAFKALKISGALPGEWVAISGAGGGVGNLAIMYAKAMGYRVVAVDVGDSKRKESLASGAEHYVDVTAEQPLEDAIQSITTVGVKAVIVTAPSPAAYQLALGLLAPFGTLVCVGIPPKDGTLTLHPIELIDKDLRLIGSVVGTRGEILDALEFVRRGMVIPKTQTAKLDDLTQIAAKYASGQASAKYVISL